MINCEKSPEYHAFKWRVAPNEDELIATHEINFQNQVPFPDQENRMNLFRFKVGTIHSIFCFILDKSHTLTIHSGKESDYKPLHKKIFTVFRKKASFLKKDPSVLFINDVSFADLQKFFQLVNQEPRLAYIDLEAEMAFTEFGKPSLSKRLKAVEIDPKTLDPKFLDPITKKLMNDPVLVMPNSHALSVDDLGRDGSVSNRRVCDRKTFRTLQRRTSDTTPLRDLPIAVPQPHLKYELLKIVRKVEQKNDA